MHDIAEFLGGHEPFSGGSEADLDALSQRVEVEFFEEGARIMAQGEGPQKRIGVVRRGAVELVDAGRVMDVLTEGEMFGHPSMLSGLPTGFEVRAAEDSLVYSIAAEDVIPLLARPAGLRFLGRSILDRPRPAPDGPELGHFDVSGRPAVSLAGERPVMADPQLAVRDAVRRMEKAGTSSVLVELGDGEYGIVTDRDLRVNVIAAGRGPDVAVSEVMTAPASVVEADRSGAEVMMLMLERGIQHVPVVGEDGSVVGVIRQMDLLAAQTRTPFMLRRAIADATRGEQLGEIADRLNESVVALRRAGLDHVEVSSIISAVSDAMTRRMIEIAVQNTGPPPADFVWLALGSDGRRETVPSSDMDSGLSWRDEPGMERDDVLSYMQSIGTQVAGSLKFTGRTLDAHGVTAGGDFACRSLSDWERAIAVWLDEPDDNKRLIAASILLDGRPVFGPPELDPKLAFFEGESRIPLERWMLRLALSARPPTGFLRDFVVEHTGERRGKLDVKHGGLLPIVGVARFAGLRAGTTSTSTLERLRAASEAGVVEGTQAETLREAFDLFRALRLDHQVNQLERGKEPDDDLEMKDLLPLTRRYIREAFREVAAVQKALGGELKRAY